jgi:hypothetical protein
LQWSIGLGRICWTRRFGTLRPLFRLRFSCIQRGRPFATGQELVHVLVIDVGDLARTPDGLDEVAQHRGLIVPAPLREADRVLVDVAVDQLLDGGGGARIIAVAERIAALIDLALAALPAAERRR